MRKAKAVSPAAHRSHKQAVAEARAAASAAYKVCVSPENQASYQKAAREAPLEELVYNLAGIAADSSAGLNRVLQALDPAAREVALAALHAPPVQVHEVQDTVQLDR